MKRTFDLIGAFVLLLLLSLPMAIVAALIRWKMGPPVLFRQLRAGQHGRPFTLYKFRTMTNETDQDGRLLPPGERITPLGRFLRKASLDELPSLVNVLRGEMSLVGPRPLLMEYLPLYNAHQARRHEVKPGITGWAQVNGRNAISWEEKFDLDVWYVDNRSFWLDLKILWLTVLKVIKSEGITPKDQTIMPKFQGTAAGREH